MTPEEVERLPAGIKERALSEFFDEYFVIGIPIDCPEQVIKLLQPSQLAPTLSARHLEDEIIALAQVIINRRHRECQVEERN